MALPALVAGYQQVGFWQPATDFLYPVLADLDHEQEKVGQQYAKSLP